MGNKQKIGYFGGTFDPFHLGHLNLVVEVLEKTSLDKVCICPTALSPFKVDSPPVAIDHRLAMLNLALEGLGNIYLEEIEAQNQEISYTYETLTALRKMHPEVDWTLILSDDLTKDLDRWKNAQELLKEFDVIIVQRSLKKNPVESISPWIYEIIKDKFLQVRSVEVSSSEVRKRLKNKLYCEHLIPLKILDYIYKYKLYS